ncbi:hypothetical protein EC973_008703 [Apophysomyces ossiformis]|uniref:Protein kinase domain-containing protein n=1 Tax=Apophysomyces ossiformis TaxID=679940 RepID=A0A8H7EPK7_9FUNG|nr:hypothetical protein EC973_008703 [Apophysomyces ossiformis]
MYKAATVAVRLVEEENQRKTQLPHYPGLERFEIIQKVGDGAFSNVYKARDIETGKAVAVKVVRKHELDASEQGRTHLHPTMKKKTKVTERASILKEVQIMRNIKHPNIVQLIEFSESDDYYFLVLELCEGGELFHQIVKLTYFSENLARHVIVQLAESVRFLHEQCGVVHRDIKPENILFEPIPIIPSDKPVRLFDEDKVDEGVFQPGIGGGGIGNVKLADFGLSKVIWDNSTLTPCGTVGYTAPEIVRDQRYSKAVDMWAIGCVLYTLLSGFPPFYDESIRALTDKVAKGQYTFLSPWWDPISDEAKDLIRHLLCVDPNERYTINQFFEHPWITGDRKKEIRRVSALKPVVEPTDGDSSRRRKDVFSPGVTSIKEILDITYAVQRMGEEKHHRNFHDAVIEEEDEEEDEEEEEAERGAEETKATAAVLVNVNAMAEKLAQNACAIAANTFTAPQIQPMAANLTTPLPRRRKNGFELNLDNATLLKNRRGQQAKPAVIKT